MRTGFFVIWRLFTANKTNSKRNDYANVVKLLRVVMGLYPGSGLVEVRHTESVFSPDSPKDILRGVGGFTLKTGRG